jgi:hypothetical protein
LDNIQGKGGEKMAIGLIHCRVHDAIWSGRLVALGVFLVETTKRGIKTTSYSLRSVECAECLVGRATCQNQVSLRVPEELLKLLS